MRQYAFLAALFLASGAQAAFNAASRGTSSAQFLKLGAGARASGMGEAASAVVDDATALYWNPAAMTKIHATSLSLMHGAVLGGSSYDYLAFAQDRGDAGAYGVSLQSLAVPTIYETDSSGVGTGGAISPLDIAVSAGYAYSKLPYMENYSAGLSFKYIRSRLSKTASAGAVDMGFLSPDYELWTEGPRTRLAFACQNLGSQMRYNQDYEPLPLTLKFGAAFLPEDHWAFALDFVAPRDNRPYAALGIELKNSMLADMAESGALGFAGRAGFNSRTLGGDISGLSGLSLGFGLRYHWLSVDYAFLPMGELGIDHRISLTLRFDTQLPRRFEDNNFETPSPWSSHSSHSKKKYK